MLRWMGKSGGSRSNKQAEPQRSLRARPVSDLLPQAGGVAFRRFGFVQSAVVSRWREIVGERYAGVSSPESIRFPPGKRKEGVLTLVVEGAHAPMMQHVAPVIAAAVYRPMPGSVRSSASLSGKRPPCCLVTSRAQARRLRARA